MIHSMTGYARHQIKADWGSATWEIRSVNQRYLETYWRMPEQFRALEPVLREKIRKALQRGKVECSLRFEADQAKRGELQLNQSLAEQLIKNAEWVQQQAGGQINPVDILRWPGVMEAQELDMDSINTALISGFDQVVEDFKSARGDEGANLEEMIATRLTAILEQVDIVEAHMPEITKWQREKLVQKLEDLTTNIDESRLEQELIYLAQKQDVAEELDRLKSHVKETRKILSKGGACGRRLDFMMQEFNREANTLGSKSINTDVTASAVELKVLIEQMREQIANIE